MSYRITVVDSRGRTEVHEVAAGTISLGRDPECAVRLDDPAVADRHLRVARREQTVYVQDLGAGTAVRVGGVPLPREAAQAVGPDDAIEIGSLAIRIALAEPAATARRRDPVSETAILWTLQTGMIRTAEGGLHLDERSRPRGRDQRALGAGRRPDFAEAIVAEPRQHKRSARRPIDPGRIAQVAGALVALGALLVGATLLL